MTTSAIVVAGGSGRRFGGPKQFAVLGAATVASHSVLACRSVADEVILVAPQGMHAETHGADRVVQGGATRSASVRAGLSVVDAECDVVIVHDAARPLASERLFLAVVAELADDTVAGAICGREVTDTIKRVAEIDGRRRVTDTLERAELVAIQTPQAFRRSVLETAHRDHAEATDDAALVELVGGVVVVVPGEEHNIKITSPADLGEAERLLAGHP